MIDHDWIQIPFSEAVLVNPSRQLTRSALVPYVEMAAVNEFQREIGEIVLREYKGSGSRFINGDTLFARITPCLENGKTAFVSQLQHEQVGWGSTEFIVLCGKPNVTDNLFVYYLAISPKVRDHAIKSMSGTSGRQRVSTESFERLLIELPPLPIQKRIAEILGRLDDKIEVNRRINRTLEAMAQALYKHWFVDFGPFQDGSFVDSELGPIPEGWRVGNLGDLAKVEKDTVDPQTLSPLTPYIGLADMPKGSIALDAWGEAKDSTSTKFRMQAGQILFGKLRPYFKKVGIAPVDGVCSTDIYVVIPRKPDFYGFVLAQLIQQEFIDYTESVSDGTRMPRVNWAMMAKYSIALPEVVLLKKFGDIVSPWAKIIIKNVEENRQLSIIRDYLLPKLLSGEVQITAAEQMSEEVIA